MLEAERAVLIRYVRDEKQRRGSGLRVGGRFVLTADHCADGTDHRVVVGGREYPATVHVRSGDTAVDMAVLEAPGLPEKEPLACALVNRQVATSLKGCLALGFPVWKGSPDQPRLAQASGYVPTSEDLDPLAAADGEFALMTLKIIDPEASGRRVMPGDLDQPGSLWAGMSGAVVVTADDLVVGVVRSHTLAEGGRSLTVTPMDGINRLPTATAARVWGALEVQDPSELAMVPLPAKGFGQPDPRTDIERLKDLRIVQRQVRSILTARDDPAFAERFFARVREHRAGRADRTQFELIPDRYGGKTLAAVTRRPGLESAWPGELLIRADALPDVTRALAFHELVDPSRDQYGELVEELDRKVVRLGGGPLDPIQLANLATKLRGRGVPISANYCLTSMGGYGEGIASPEPTAGPAPVFPMAAKQERKAKSPVRIVIIDTGVYGARDDGWLAGLETKKNREDLDDLPQDGYLDLAAGQGSFCAGIVQQIVPKARIVVCKELDSEGLAHELRVARALVRQVRKGLKAGQHVIVNLSFGTETADDEQPVALGAALEVIDEASKNAGLETVVVAAAGNFGHERPCYPAAFPTVTAVAALTQKMLPAEWSSRGEWVDISAIGEGVRSTFVPGVVSPSVDFGFVEFPQNAWALWSGTSFAAPQVTGAIAKIAIDEDVTPAEARRRLVAGAKQIPLYGKQVEILPRT